MDTQVIGIPSEAGRCLLRASQVGENMPPKPGYGKVLISNPVPDFT